MKKLRIIALLFCLCIGLLNVSGCESEEVEVINHFEDDACSSYFYHQLDDDEKLAYEAIYNGIYEWKEEIETQFEDSDTLDEIAQKVLADHPEFYYCRMITAISDSGEVFPNYAKELIDEEDYEDTKAQVDDKVEEIIAGIDPNASEYDKARFVYDYLIANVEYVEDSDYNQDIRSVLLNGQSVCAGYAKTAQYLLDKLGVQCAYVTGESKEVTGDQDNLSHAWNLVSIDGDYYYMDATWGDRVEENVHTCYGFFMLSSDEMHTLYTPDYEVESTSQYSNRYTRENHYVSQYDPNLITTIMVDAMNSGATTIEIKCAPEAYESVVTNLITYSAVFDLLYNAGAYREDINYVEVPELSLIEIIL